MTPGAGKAALLPSRASIDFPALFAALLAITCWASNFPAVRYVLQAYEPGQIGLLRFYFASAAMAAYAVAVRMPLPARGDLPVFCFFGLTGMALSNVGLMFGLRTVSAGAGSFLVGTIPIFSAILARTFLRERVGAVGWLGIAISFGGMGLIALGEGGGFSFNPGAGLVVFSAFCQSVFYVFQKPLHRRYSPVQITSYAIWSGNVCLLVFAPGLGDAIAAAPLSHTLVVIYLGWVPIAVGMLAWNYALSRAKAAKVTSAMYLMPALALSLAFVWLGEVPALLTVGGGMVALLGVAVLNLWGK